MMMSSGVLKLCTHAHAVIMLDLISSCIILLPENQKGVIAVQQCSIENQKGGNAVQLCSIENQKGVNAVQRCSIENQKGAIAIAFVQQ